MCGIVGIASNATKVVGLLINSLKTLEYRGYDSTGVAFIDDQQLKIVKTTGKVKDLERLLAKQQRNDALIGIGHTRWATHGAVNQTNAHPLFVDNLAIVHNGVIENYQALKQRLLDKGVHFTTDTDTEVIAQLIVDLVRQGNELLTAIQLTVEQLVGAYVFALLAEDQPETIYAVKKGGNPLVVGLGNRVNYLASDVHGLLAYTNRFLWLEDGNVLVLTAQTVQVLNCQGKEIKLPEKQIFADQNLTSDLGTYEYYMQKEIFEQATVFTKNTDHLTLPAILTKFGVGFEQILPQVKMVHLVACGSSYHAALVAKYWLEQVGIAAQVEIASEYRYRQLVVLPNTLFITLSQSGETADVIAALHKAKTINYLTYLTFCNVAESTIARESDFVYLINAGPEIGVATTKAFTAQLLGLWYFTQCLRSESNFTTVLNLPSLANQILTLDREISGLARLLQYSNSVFYLGRGVGAPIAMEGALKLKEISYLHAEAYPAGELKHGSLALIDKQIFVIALLPNDGLQEKMISNLQEVSTRGGQLILFADQRLEKLIARDWHYCLMPAMSVDLVPMLYVIALQLLAYHVAFLRGLNVDQPRNLAKSVTVE